MLMITPVYSIINTKRMGVIDFMNRNAITSIAMIYTLWSANHQDLLDIVTPFVLYAVGKNAKPGKAIQIAQIASYIETEFGYTRFDHNVIKRILGREIRRKTNKIENKDNEYYLVCSLADYVDNFSKKRIESKARTDQITTALADYLNRNNVNSRTNYTQAETETALLSFFQRQGGAIITSIQDLKQVMYRNNALNYYIACFILEESQRKSVIMDYLVELVKGYFVTTAIYLQPDNQNITKASFSAVTFYLDTRLLLSCLGYKTPEENKSVQEMLSSLQKSGAKFACFDYNVNEVNNILEAYKLSTLQLRANTYFTLEYFDEKGRSFSLVDFEQKHFSKRIEEKGIKIVSKADLFGEQSQLNIQGMLDESALEAIILDIKPNYNTQALADDVGAINTVNRLRKD